MKTWSKYPVIFEINIWVWLRELAQKCQRQVNLAAVVETEPQGRSGQTTGATRARKR